MKLHSLVVALLTSTLLINKMFAQENSEQEQLKYKKFYIGIDVPKLLFTTGGMKVNRHKIQRGEIFGRFYFHENFYANLGLGFSNKKSDDSSSRSDYQVTGKFARLGVGADVGPGKVARFVFAYNLCYSGYKKEVTFSKMDDFWNEPYHTILESSNYSTVFHELYFGFRLNFMNSNKVGVFIENGFKCRMLPESNQTLDGRDFIPGYGTYAKSSPMFFAFNLTSGISF